MTMIGERAVETLWRPGRPVDVRRTLGPVVRGPGDPAHKVTADGTFWRAALTPSGPATLALRPVAPGGVHAAAWGPGAAWSIQSVPDLLGARDDPAAFEPRHPLLHEMHRRYPGVRVPRTGLVLDALVPAVLEQRVTGTQAHQAWRFLLRRYGTPAPGPAPAGMRVPPPPALLLDVPTWAWHRAGVDITRQRAIRAAATVAARLEECCAMAPADALARLRVVPGVGVWTAAEAAQRALGDADAVSVGDLHIPGTVGWALLGRPLDDDGMLELLAPWAPHRHRVVPGVGVWTAAETAQRALGDADAVSVGDLHIPGTVGWALLGRPLDDDGMLELLAPWAPHRHRVVRLVELSGVRRPRFAPRFSPIDYRSF